MAKINYGKKLVRDSNMELLRILAMLGVLAVHADFFSLGIPTKQDCMSDPIVTGLRFVIESFTIISVNLFVLISGWYGIRPKVNRMKEFIFQILFFNISFFVVFSLISPDVTFSKNGLLSLLMFNSQFWFVKAYLMLYLLSPVLNSYIDNSSKRHLYLIIVAFFLFQTFYGWSFSAVLWFDRGYSALSFVGLYLLARYFRLTGFKYLNRSRAVILFLFFVIANSSLAYCLALTDHRGHIDLLYAYNSPFVIIASITVFYFFTTFTFKNRFINIIAISSFAAFLFHANYFFIDSVYVPTVKNWFTNHSIFVFSLLVTAFILSLFFISIAIDKVRMKIYNCIVS